MQDYVELDATKPLKTSIPLMQTSMDSVASLFSGTAFPTENLFVGMPCVRTDQNMLYICTAVSDSGSATWKGVLSLTLGAGKAETDGNGATITSTYLKKTDASSTYLTKTSASSTYLPLSGGTLTGALTVKSSITATGNITGAKVYNAVYNDYAELFPRGDGAEAGDILMLDEAGAEERYVKAKAGGIAAGVVSDEYAHLIGGEEPPAGEDFLSWNLKKYVPVSLAGRVHVKVAGIVEKGMYIVPWKDGVGRGTWEYNPREAVGIALSRNCFDNATRIRMLVL